MLNQILNLAIAAKASDVHLNVGLPPMFRINTQVTAANHPPITAEDADRMLKHALPPERIEEFEKRRDADFCYVNSEGRRFRVNAHYQRGKVAMAIRLINDKIRPLDQLCLPEVVSKLTNLPRGLVLVTGGTGSGKSTTLAAMIDVLNKRESMHIITLEDPVEYAFVNQKSVIEQREVGTDVPDFASGLRHVLRQDPDAILVGEMRDLETISAAITAAETGHLVLSTLHTMNAPQTIERIVDVYPADQQSHVRSMLAGSLQAVISQTLFKRIDQPGMVPAVEIMLCNPAVKNCIRENRLFEINNIISTGRQQGMQTLDDSIKGLYQRGMISREDALSQASAPDKLERMLAA